MPGEQPVHHLRCGFGVEAGQGGLEGGPGQVGEGLPAAAVRGAGGPDGAGGGVRQRGGIEAGVVLAQSVGEPAHLVGGRARRGDTQPEVLAPAGPGPRAQVRNPQLRQVRGEPVGIGAGDLGAVAPTVEIERQQAVAVVGAGQVDRPRKSGRPARHGHRGGIGVGAIRVDPHPGTRRPAARAHVEKVTIRCGVTGESGDTRSNRWL